MDKPPTPNLDIIKIHRPQMQAIHDFLEFMGEQGYTLQKLAPNRLALVEDAIPATGQKLDRQLAQLYNFDYDKAEEERQAIIDTLLPG